MTGALVVVLLGAFLLALFAGFINANPASIANALRAVVPFIFLIVGLGLTLLGRAGLGLPLLLLGGSWLWRQRNVGTFGSRQNSQKSVVRSAWLEMELDHDTGDLEGYVLTGSLEGQQLSDLDDDDLIELYLELRGDGESAGLMEAYLDRRIPAWRENSQGGAGAGQSHAASSGPMSEQEAYQILGLPQGATASEIKAAHRRLMKAVHPDSGGSTFLAARINEAKDLLLN